MQKLFEKFLTWKKSPTYVPFDVASHLRTLHMRNILLEETLAYVLKNIADQQVKARIQQCIEE